MRELSDTLRKHGIYDQIEIMGGGISSLVGASIKNAVLAMNFKQSEHFPQDLLSKINKQLLEVKNPNLSPSTTLKHIARLVQNCNDARNNVGRKAAFNELIDYCGEIISAPAITTPPTARKLARNIFYSACPPELIGSSPEEENNIALLEKFKISWDTPTNLKQQISLVAQQVSSNKYNRLSTTLQTLDTLAKTCLQSQDNPIDFKVSLNNLLDYCVKVLSFPVKDTNSTAREICQEIFDLACPDAISSPLEPEVGDEFQPAGPGYGF